MLTTTTPVTLYRSTDADAPQITPTEGAIKTVFEACLVTGYGDKQPLGFEMPFSDNHRAVFRSKNEQSSRLYFQLDNSEKTRAQVTGYRTMTALNQGTGQFPERPLGIVSEYAPHNRKTHWALIGCDKALWFITCGDYSRYSQMSFIGDFKSTVAADPYNFCLINTVDDSTYLSGSQRPRFNPNHRGTVAMDYNALNPVTVSPQSALFHGFVQYPDPICQGVNLAPVFLREHLQGDYSSVRGLLPGVFASDVYQMNQPTFTILDHFEGTTDQFMAIKHEYHTSFINVSNWAI
ncbi:MAG: hypothetical protein Q4B71_00295 [Cardiobacteriaceae bacterium]|nr:hypothetical protein [Cardiobacteriaceae bacterium]